jgi:hypothetical protein
MKKILVTMAERKWIRDHASIEMGKTVKYRVIDLDKVVAQIRQDREKYNLSPYVDIIPLSPDMHKSPNKMPTYQKDPVTGVYYGLPNGEDDYGNIRWQRLQLSDNLSLNLENEMECKLWAVLRFNSDIEGSPFQKQYPYYKIFDPVVEAKAEKDEIQLMKMAFDMVDKLQKSPREMVFFARYLGEDLRENANINIIEGALLRYAKNHPGLFVSKFNDKNRSFGERFHTALALGIIDQYPDRGYVYRELPIGHSEEEAIKMLSLDNTLMTAINNLIYEQDKVLKIVENEGKMAQGLKLQAPAAKSDKKEKEKEVVTDFE